MGRLLLSVNKSNLLRLKEELSFAKDGLELLEEKKEALMVHVTTLSTKAEQVRTRVNQNLYRSYAYLREAVLIHARFGCERASLATSLGEEVQIKEKSFMGVVLPKVTIKLPKLLPPYGFHGTGAAMDSVLKMIYQGMEIIAELAEIEVGLFRLVTEIRKTIKRLNALENIHIPLYQSTVKYMEENLEEKEREFLFQLKRERDHREETEHETF
jgi:V/A-type H+-transporting ATPase subunit D